jgi:hypothetical protein
MTRRIRERGWGWGALVAIFLAGCSAIPKPKPVDYSTFCDAKAELAQIEEAFKKPRNQTVSLGFAAPYMPTKVSARGGVAMSPPGDLRMILTGPGGVTGLDLWLHDGRFRFAVPAIDRVIRGDTSTPAEKKRGLPVDFLRWWMLDPLAGELLWAGRDDDGLHFVLRDRDAYVDATIAKDGRVTATRTTWNEAGEKIDEETLSASSMGCGHIEYKQRSTELSVEATCEKELGTVPARAFVDPDSTDAGASP